MFFRELIHRVLRCFSDSLGQAPYWNAGCQLTSAAIFGELHVNIRDINQRNVFRISSEITSEHLNEHLRDLGKIDQSGGKLSTIVTKNWTLHLETSTSEIWSDLTWAPDTFQPEYETSFVESLCPKPALLVTWGFVRINNLRLILHRSFRCNLLVTRVFCDQVCGSTAGLISHESKRGQC